MKKSDSPWLPVIMPLVVFGVVAVVLSGLGMALLTLAFSTRDMFHAPVPHSTAVIIVALIITFLIGGVAAFVASRPEKPAPSSAHHH